MESVNKINNCKPEFKIYYYLSNFAYWLIFLAAVIPVIVKNRHVPYPFLIACAVLAVVQLIPTLWNSKKQRNAASLLSRFYFVLILCSIVLLAGKIFGGIDNSTLFNYVTGKYSLYRVLPFLVVGLVAIFVIMGFCKTKKFGEKSVVFFSFVLSLLGPVICFFVWQDYHSDYGRIILIFTLGVSILWLTFTRISQIAGFRSVFSILFSALISLFEVINSLVLSSFYGTAARIKILGDFFAIRPKITVEYVRELFPWWLVITAAAVMFVLGIFLIIINDECGSMISENKNTCLCSVSSINEKILLFGAILLFIAKKVTTNYCPYSIVFCTIICILSVYLLKARNKQEIILENEDFSKTTIVIDWLIVYCSLFIFVQLVENIALIHILLLIVIVVFLIKICDSLFAADINQGDTAAVKRAKSTLSLKKDPENIPMICFSFLSLIFFGVVVTHNLSLVSALMYISIILVSLLFFFFIKKEPPNAISYEDKVKNHPVFIFYGENESLKWIFCLFAAIIGVVFCCTSGVRYKMTYDSGAMNTEIRISAMGSSEISDIECTWSDSLLLDAYNAVTYGDVNDTIHDSFKTDSKEKNISLPIKGERLILKTTDNKGIVSYKVYWYPLWFYTE